MKGLKNAEASGLILKSSHNHRAWQPVRETRARWGRWLAARPGYPPVPETTAHDIAVKGLPPAMAGLRIVQLSDLHHGLYVSLRAVEQAVEMTNRLHADVVVLTGDFVTQSWVHVEPVADALSRLEASMGIYAVMGNHDHRAGVDAMERNLTQHGIRVLRNQHALLQRGGDRLGLVGVDDLRYSCDLARAVRGMPLGVPRILLCHNPRIITYAAREHIDFVVSGHTHGGQIMLPLVGPLFRSRYRSGLHRLRETQIYVSRGIGKVVLPVRLGCPPEIPVFRLRPSLGDHN